MFEKSELSKHTSEASIAQADAEHQYQSRLVIAKKFPRDYDLISARMFANCERPRFAEKARYQIPRAGGHITGPSIHLAKMLATEWGNLDFGVQVLEGGESSTLVEAYCLDYERNTKAIRRVSVSHFKKQNKKVTKLTDPHMLMEHIMSHGMRALRSAILQIIPSELQEEALEKCDQALQAPTENKKNVIAEAIVRACAAGEKLGVSADMIKERFKLPVVSDMNKEMLVELKQIFTALEEGEANIEEYFDPDQESPDQDARQETAVPIDKEATTNKTPRSPKTKNKTELFENIV